MMYLTPLDHINFFFTPLTSWSKLSHSETLSDKRINIATYGLKWSRGCLTENVKNHNKKEDIGIFIIMLLPFRKCA